MGRGKGNFSASHAAAALRLQYTKDLPRMDSAVSFVYRREVAQNGQSGACEAVSYSSGRRKEGDGIHPEPGV